MDKQVSIIDSEFSNPSFITHHSSLISSFLLQPMRFFARGVFHAPVRYKPHKGNYNV